MILVADIMDNVKEVLGGCDDDLAYNRLNEAVRLLKNTGLWNPLVGFMDICTRENTITLPDDVDVPLAINVGGTPADFRNKWYEFHLNGPGSNCSNAPCVWNWADEGNFPTFRDPHKPSSLIATPDTQEHPGAKFRVYGYDECDKWIMTPDCVTGALVDGFDVPILYPYSVPTTIKVKRITRVSKPVTVGFVRLSALDPGVSSGSTLLGYFKPSDTEPSFRRITVSGAGCNWLHANSRCCTTWVRMRFRKKFSKINSLQDLIFLNSETAILMAVMAMRKYRADLSEEYEKYMNHAKKALELEQKAQNGPNQIRIQFTRGVYASKIGENLI